ncbi:MAG: UMP kinase [Desulfomonilaceae bacterium]
MSTVSPKGYRRALLKISGEALAGEKGFGLDGSKISWIANEIVSAAEDGRKVGVVVGGGNIMRGVDAQSVGAEPLAGDEMGMVATVINALALKSAIQSQGRCCRVMSSFEIGKFVDVFSRESLLECLKQDDVVIFAGGTGNPCFTTDSAAALRAVQMKADVMVKATQVDGVYDKDPKKFPDARRFETITPEETLQRQLKVIDAASIEILGRYSIPTIVLNLHVQGNIKRAMIGEKVGTTIIA